MSLTAEMEAIPTTEAMRALGARLIRSDLILFPVRHHSPACAWHLRQLFASCTPSTVLVEGPGSFTALLPSLTHAEAKMPLAIYTYAVRKGAQGDERRAAYYPFCDYSPELVALREAAARGIEARFIDLEFSAQCLFDGAEEAAEQAESLLDERRYERSQYLQELARAEGCRDQEELWEQLFEIPGPGRSLADQVTQMAAYCQLARLGNTAAELAADGTLAREAEMAWHIRQVLAERKADAGPVLVVLGGFHAVVMPELLAAPVVRPAPAGASLVDAASALIRYSFDRLDRLNGYAAGMTSPAWQQRVWDGLLRHEQAGQKPAPRLRQEAALNLLFDIAGELRARHALALPMPTLAAAYEQLLRLAALRQREAPGRDDVMDGVISCFIKGDADADGALVRAVAQKAFGGQALGKVPAGTATPPLVKDFAYRARRQRLKIDDSQPRRATLDIYRRPEHRVTSRLMHGLSLLGVPFALRSAGPDFVHGLGLGRLQEHWEYSCTAATEAALVEASLYGGTVPQAVANRFAQTLAELEASGQASDARKAASLLVQACVLGLHDHLPRVMATLRDILGNDPGFESVTAAAGTIGLLWESREPLEARDVEELPALLQAAYQRAIFLGADLHAVRGDGSAAVEALTQLRELLVSAAGRGLDAALYWTMVAQWQAQHTSLLVRGAAAGLRYGAGLLGEAELGAVLEGYLNGMLAAAEAVSFLRGLLQVAREVAWQQPELLGVIDRLLQTWDESTFVGNLPELRLAFAEMTPRETDRIAVAAAGLHGAADLGRLLHADLSAAEVQRHLLASAALRELLLADGLAGWVGA